MLEGLAGFAGRMQPRKLLLVESPGEPEGSEQENSCQYDDEKKAGGHFLIALGVLFYKWFALQLDDSGIMIRSEHREVDAR